MYSVPRKEYDRKRRLTPEEILNKKQELLFKFDEIERRGIKLPRKYSLRDELDVLEFEYEKIKRQKEINNSVQFSRKMLMACITGIEYLNNKFDPFDVNLNGWSESIMENVNDYDEVFEELHEKYKSKVQVAPEIKLILMISGSAFMFHLTNTMFKSSLPNLNDILQNNPELMKKAANIAASRMNEGGMGGMGGGMNGGMGGGMNGGMGGGMGGGMPNMMSAMMGMGNFMGNTDVSNNDFVGASKSVNITETKKRGGRKPNKGNNDQKTMAGPTGYDSLLATIAENDNSSVSNDSDPGYIPNEEEPKLYHDKPKAPVKRKKRVPKPPTNAISLG